MLEGIVSGGGALLVDIVNKNGKDWVVNGPRGIAGTAMAWALLMPAAQILANTGQSEADIDEKLAECIDGNGWDMKTNTKGNMIDMGIIDPAKVTKSALRNAVSVACTILSTNAIITLARSYESSE